MAVALLYCTVDVTPELIAELITESQRPRNSYNTWSLVREPSQTTLDEYGTSIPVDPFRTGYANATTEMLREDVARRLPDYGDFLTPGTFAVLDERSIRDKTVLIVHKVVRYPEEEEEEEEGDAKVPEEDVAALDVNQGDDQGMVETWKEWRVEFLKASYMIAVLEEKDFLFLEELGGGDHVDENGVFEVPDFEM